jgi:hypothetical protein
MFVLNSDAIAKYSNENPNSLLNTVPKYLAYGVVAVVFMAGVFVFGAAVLAVL